MHGKFNSVGFINKSVVYFMKYLGKCLQTIADTGRLVIVSIQLLNPWQLSVFNSIQLLKRGGETVYFGSPGANGESLLVSYLPLR